MNLSILRTLTLSLSAAIAPVSLMAQGPIHTKIPFDFTVGSKSFAAGEYRVEHPAPQILAIRSTQGNVAMLVMARNASVNTKPGVDQLTFNRYGDRYFLSKLSQDQRGWELPKSTVEKELLLKRASAEPVRLAAAGK